MVFTFQCPACVSGALLSTVSIANIQRNIKVSGAWFDVSGNLNLPVVKHRVTFFCSNSHTTINLFNNIPDEVRAAQESFISNVSGI